MSWNMSSVSKRVYVRKATDGTQNYKNVAQGDAALSNAYVAREKLKLAQLSTADKHELNKLKFARESIKLEQEAKEYWNSLSDEDRQRIAGQMFVENQVQLQAYQDRAEDAKKISELNRAKQAIEVKTFDFEEKLWRIFIVFAIICFVLPMAVAFVVGFFYSLFS